jgi:hypothetical protein
MSCAKPAGGLGMPGEAKGPNFRELKRAAGRPKDLEAIAELQALLDERRRK